MRESTQFAEALATALHKIVAASTQKLEATRLQETAAVEAAAHASKCNEVSQREVASATAITRRSAANVANAHAAAVSKTFSENLRRVVTPLVARLTSTSSSCEVAKSAQQPAIIHGWLNELAWAQEGYAASINAVLKAALANVARATQVGCRDGSMSEEWTRRHLRHTEGRTRSGRVDTRLLRRVWWR